jgi:glucose-1-phosphate cytidylyltransferase
MTQVVILAGGLGTRFREETENKPKPMINIGNKPILWHIMKYYAEFGFTDFIIATGYLKNVIYDYFLNYSVHNSTITVNLRDDEVLIENKVEGENWKVTLVDTGLTETTGGRIHRIKNLISSDDFMCTYGDGLADVNLHDLKESHEKSKKILTITGVTPKPRYGLIKNLNSVNGMQYKFDEKGISQDLISGGFFIFNKEIFTYLGEGCDLEGNVFQKIANSKQMNVFLHHGFWQSMDNIREWSYLTELTNDGKAPWEIWKKQHE